MKGGFLIQQGFCAIPRTEKDQTDMVALLRATAAERRLLPEGRLAGPMPWVIGIMMFLTILATASGLAIGRASSALSSDIASKLTIQLPEANIARRNGQARAIVAELGGLGSVKASRKLADAELARLLAPWLGSVAGDEELPLPALIDVELARNSPRDVAQVKAAILAIAPNARVDANASWLAPLSGLMSSLQWLAFGLVILMASATAAVVVLAVRAALNTYGETIAIMHLLGANDDQIARLFERRISLDALLGGIGGLALAIITLILVGGRIGDIGSDLLGSARLGWTGWLLIFALPFIGTLLAALVARYTVKASLGRTL
jgi:cell division transport system permease protein